MPASVEIDGRSGFCGGVIRTIGCAEDYLDRNPDSILYSLGDVVHNESEMERLHSKGMVTIDHDDLEQINSASGRALLIRAHGEPPATYEMAANAGFKLIDCTCPVVLNIQKSIREAYRELHLSSRPGTIVIFGKVGHAEVLGLVGQVDDDAVVVENLEQLVECIGNGTLPVDRDVRLFSQTTMSPVEYASICEYLENSMEGGAALTVNHTICSQVASRHEKLVEFADAHDIVIFVSGKSSSNGKVLCDLCKSVNIRTYHIGSQNDINPQWFRRDDRVGVCGATSTPKWLLDRVAEHIENLQ